jgi:hypothetical protein
MFNKYINPKMKLTKRRISHVFDIRNTEFCNQIIDLSEIRDSHYLLWLPMTPVMASALMLEADKKITRKKSNSVFYDLDKTLTSFAKIIDKNFVKVDGLL